MKIFNTSDIEILDVVVTDESYRYDAIQQVSNLIITFQTPEFVEIPLLSYVVFQLETFRLKSPENYVKNGSRAFEYTLILNSNWADARGYKVRNIVDKRLKFDLTARPVRTPSADR